MKFHIEIEIDETDGKPDGKEPPASETGRGDPWGFGELRKTLWGEGQTANLPRDVFRLAEIRKTLWGR